MTLRFLLFFCAASLLGNALAQPARAPSGLRAVNESRMPPGTRVLKDLAYVENGHERQKLDLYIPAQGVKPLPLIIWIHGGAWKGGNKERSPALQFLDRGFAVASVNYRLSQHAVFPAQLEDCKTAVRWLRAHAEEYGLNMDRFGAWGGSAGGHLVAMLGVTGDTKDFDVGPHLKFSSQVQAVANYFGPADLTSMGAQSGPESTMKHDAPDSPESQLIGGPILENKEKAKKASPLTYVSRGDAPMLLVHGDKDPLVPWQQSQVLYDALQKAGVSSELRIVKNAGHGAGFGAPEFIAVAAFFKERLQPGTGSAK